MRTKLGRLGGAAWVSFQDMRSRSSSAGGPMEKLYLVLLGIALLITLAWIAFLLYGAYYLLSV
jgi:hypothetical protein